MATLTFLRSALSFRLGHMEELRRLREESLRQARSLLQLPTPWPRPLPDDDVSNPRDASQAAMLCRVWDYAAQRYQSALN